MSTTNPWDAMRPMLLKIGYSNNEIDELTIAELEEILAQDTDTKEDRCGYCEKPPTTCLCDMD